eukprot:Rhum_TRINITY_DN14611_c39_g1::Rhum_TRINITY_DN14611_c39_g1_i1::g.103508::m.103508
MGARCPIERSTDQSSRQILTDYKNGGKRDNVGSAPEGAGVASTRPPRHGRSERHTRNTWHDTTACCKTACSGQKRGTMVLSCSPVFLCLLLALRFDVRALIHNVLLRFCADGPHAAPQENGKHAAGQHRVHNCEAVLGGATKHAFAPALHVAEEGPHTQRDKRRRDADDVKNKGKSKTAEVAVRGGQEEGQPRRHDGDNRKGLQATQGGRGAAARVAREDVDEVAALHLLPGDVDAHVEQAGLGDVRPVDVADHGVRLHHAGEQRSSGVDEQNHAEACGDGCHPRHLNPGFVRTRFVRIENTQ